MDNTIAETFFETFRRLYPVPIAKVIVIETEMRFILRQGAVADFANDEAQTVIIRHHLPLEAFIERWSSNGVLRETAIVVRYVPEQEFINCY